MPTRITSLQELYDAVQNKRSVICPTSRVWGRPRPAAFIINTAARSVYWMIKRGLFLYEPKTRKRFHEAVKKAGRS